MNRKILLQIDVDDEGMLYHTSNKLTPLEEMALLSYLKLVIEQIEDSQGLVRFNNEQEENN